ncbi:MAG: DUF2249 domain-containing protein [Chitinophagaceae bacterium]|nr:DUF2249 domain-containing protein [Chitinophagaceae bacterium]
MVTVEILDVTRIEPKLKHPTIFKHFDALDAGESFTIDNDHDPKPLYYQLLGERGNIFTWEYLEQGPRRWQVKIARRSKEDQGQTMGNIAAKDIHKAEVFKAKGIDYSCGDGKTLKEAGALPDISEDTQHTAVAEAVNRPLSASQDFNKWPLGFLLDYIVNTHHRYIKDNVEVISGLTAKVAQRHGLQHQELNRLGQSIPSFLQNLLAHVNKQEQVVFPLIRQAVAKRNDTASAQEIEGDVINQSALVLQKEQFIMKEDLAYFRRLTNGYKLPDDACNSYTYLYQKLEEMEDDLKQYIHIENNILLPRAATPEKESVQ